MIGLGLGIGMARQAGGGGEPESLYDTSDFVAENPNGDEIIDADSFRLARNASNSRLRIDSVPSGDYRITGTVSTYDGGVAGISKLRIRINDNFSVRQDILAAGAVDVTVTIASGTLRFDCGETGAGARFYDFFIVAA